LGNSNGIRDEGGWVFDHRQQQGFEHERAHEIKMSRSVHPFRNAVAPVRRWRCEIRGRAGAGRMDWAAWRSGLVIAAAARVA
jgi:hypothetical protein